MRLTLAHTMYKPGFDNLNYPYDHDEQEQEYGLQHDYLLKRKKRNVINSRQGFGGGNPQRCILIRFRLVQILAMGNIKNFNG